MYTLKTMDSFEFIIIAICLLLCLLLYLTARAIDAWRQLKEAREAQLFLDTILDNIPDMVFVKEARGLRFTKFNKAGERILGIPREELIGKNDYDLFPKEQADFFTSHDRQVLESRKLADISQEPIDSRTLGKRWLRTKKVPVFDAAGRPVYLLGISEDITEKINIEAVEQERQKMEALGRLAGGIAHEINNLLQPIIMMSEIIRDNPAAFTEDGGESLRCILENARMARKIVKDVLTYSGVSHDTDLQVVDLGLLLQDSVEFVKTFLPNTVSVNVVKNCQGKVSCRLGEREFKQIMANMLLNASQAMHEKGAITITLDTATIKNSRGEPLRAGTYAEIRIADQGHGIPKDIQDKVFEPFFTTKDIGKGTGLGLSIVYSILHNWGGDIRIAETSPEGTSFLLFIPVA